MINVTAGFTALFKQYTYDKNGGSPALTTILNNYVHIVVHEIYCNEGDILKFSGENIVRNKTYVSVNERIIREYLLVKDNFVAT